MKRVIIIHSVIILIITFIMAGCRVTGRDYPLLSTLSDVDGDGIPDVYDYPDNPTTQEIACTVNGQTVYLRCDLTEDCNCNGIHDGEERETTEKCGWGCVLSNSRTYIMIGTGLVGAYILGQYVNWPFWQDDEKEQEIGSDGKPVEYVDILSIDYEKSYFKLSDENGTKYMIYYVDGTCGKRNKENNEITEQYDCKLESKNQLDEFPVFSKKQNEDPEVNFILNNIRYSFNKQDSAQKISVVDTRKGTQYIKDPNWLGIPFTGRGLNSARFELRTKTNQGGLYFFDNLLFKTTDDEPDSNGVCYELDRSNVISNVNPANYLFYVWNRITCESVPNR